MADSPLSVIILAAGEGSRMRSSRPKPLHHLCGRPMIEHVVNAAAGTSPDRVVVVVGHRGDWVSKALIDRSPSGVELTFVEQPEQLGTGDAAAVGLTGVADPEADVLVLPGDAPLLRPETLRDLVATHRSSGAAATLLTAVVDDPTGYGRILRRKDGGVASIVEERDASAEERAVTEVNTSVYCFKRSLLAPALRRLHPTNAQGEYYLTDVISVLASAGHLVAAITVVDPTEVAGVNDRSQLADAERHMRRRINAVWMGRGVTMWSPEHTYIDCDVQLDPDVVLMPGVILQGATTVASGAELGPDVVLRDCVVGRGAVITSSTAEFATIGEHANVGPYVHLTGDDEVPAHGRVRPQRPAITSPPEGSRSAR